MKQNKKKTISSEPYKKSIFLFSSLDTLEAVMEILCGAFGIDASTGSGNDLQLNRDGECIQMTAALSRLPTP